MPLEGRALFQLGLLLLAVPVQFYISKHMSATEFQRSTALRNLFNSAVGIKEQYFSWTAWQKWCTNLIDRVHNTYNLQQEESDASEEVNGESPAIEVMKYNDPKGYFAGSPEPRDPRPPEVKYRVGQVIKHKKWGYRGVIIGWDAKARAPEFWLRQMHPKDKKSWREMGNYLILVDTRDREPPQNTYIPQENIEILTSTKIIHPDLDNYFEGFDGAQYLPRPSLRTLYPHD